eukprot:g21053.t1
MTYPGYNQHQQQQVMTYPGYMQQNPRPPMLISIPPPGQNNEQSLVLYQQPVIIGEFKHAFEQELVRPGLDLSQLVMLQGSYF